MGMPAETDEPYDSASVFLREADRWHGRVSRTYSGAGGNFPALLPLAKRLVPVRMVAVIMVLVNCQHVARPIDDRSLF